MGLMLNVKDLCTRIDRTLLDVIAENPLAATLMLGNLYHAMDQATEENSALLHATLLGAKKKLTSNHIQVLWSTANTIPYAKLIVMDSAQVEILRGLKHEIIVDFDFFKHVDAASIVKLGQQIEFYRDSLVALVRKHLYDKKLSDPFSKSSFSYKLLTKGSTEQNSRYFAQYVKDCSSLPLDNLVLLGTQYHEIATLIMMDLQACKERFEISSRFAHIHPKLRKEISKNWKDYLDTFPLNSHEEKFITTKLPELKKQFAEFKDVNADSRVKRNYQIEEKPEENWGFFKSCCYQGFKLGVIIATPVTPITAPFFIGYSAYCLYDITRPKNLEGTNAPSQPSSQQHSVRKKAARW